jgi:phosphopantothenoylcysteine decarboxylase/phosphopantothenate--cysteine ligase
VAGPGGGPGASAAGRLAGKVVVLGVCGGIAAYKSVEVCRRLGDAGALVRPVLTRGAARFVTELTFSALAGEPAQTSLFGAGAAVAVPHIALARGADLVVVAPATARLIGSYAAGISSDLLTATLLATRAPVVVCPAMHTEMWEHPAVQDNMAVLRRRGVHVVGPDVGRLAGGDVGSGRLAEPEAIVASAIALLAPATPLRGVRAVVSAGGTREPVDPVRYIGNRSSGKQGYAVAAELLRRGASVTLVTSADLVPPPGAAVVSVETAAEMAGAVLAAAGGAAVVVMAAAVADYRPEVAAGTKLKKTAAPFTLNLVPNPDILTELGARRRPGQVVVGFAAETSNGQELIRLGREKLSAKGADVVVANEVAAPGTGFGEDDSRAVIVSRESVLDLGLVAKAEVASRLVDVISDLLGSGRDVAASSEGANR